MAQSGEITLPKVLQGRLLEIEDYQRPYAWEEKQLSDLWEDLDLLGKGHHYAGTLVIKDKAVDDVLATDGEALSRYEVVDGQQRLTTCLLLLDRVRRALEALDEFEAQGIASRLRSTYGVISVDGVELPRLALGKDLNRFWRDQILGGDSISKPELIAGEQRLVAATQFFDRRIAALIEGLDAPASTHRLKELQRRVTSGLRFLVYEVQTDAEVGVVFETLNERGRALTELEKVKNYLLYLASQLPPEPMKDLAFTINEAWSHIFQMMARRPASFEERLLRAHWICTFEPDTRQWKRIASVKARFPRSKYVANSERLSEVDKREAGPEDISGLLYEEVKKYVKGLRASATYIAEMYNDDALYHDFSADDVHQIRSATAALRRSPAVAIFQPLILAFRLTHPHDSTAYLRLIRLCETYSARVFAICQKRSNAGEPYLARIAHSVFTEEIDTDEALDRVAGLVLWYASDDEVQQNLLGSVNWYGRTAHKYVLYEYERSFAQTDSDVILWSEIVDTRRRKTTEHILPQQPAEGSTWESTFTPEQRADLTHTLGNLVLTYDNSSYSNKEYVEKRGEQGQTRPRCYFTAKLRSEQDVAVRYENWTPRAIQDRQRLIGDWAMERWAVVPPSHIDLEKAESEVEDEVETHTVESEDIETV